MVSFDKELFQKLSLHENFVLPRYDGYSTINLTSTLLSHFGVRELPSRPLNPEIVPSSMLDGIKNVVFFIVDALGYSQLEYYIATGSMPNVERFIKASQGAGTFFPLTTVFPSTTAAALTSIYTGAIPSSHGLLSYSVYVPDMNDVIDLVFSRSFSDGSRITNFDRFLQRLSAFQLLSDVDVNAVSISDKTFKGSLLSAVHHRGSVFAGYRLPSTIPTLTVSKFQESSRNWITIYWPGVDSCAHKYGPMSEECTDESYMIDSIILRVVEKLRGKKGNLEDTLLVLTADHGQVLNDESCALQLNSFPELLSMLRFQPSGERRSLYLYPKEGQSGSVRKWAEERGARVFTREEAVAIGLFGTDPIHQTYLERIGEFIVLPPGTTQWIYDPGNKIPVKFFKGAHGGLHSNEMIVPCLMTRL